MFSANSRQLLKSVINCVVVSFSVKPAQAEAILNDLKQKIAGRGKSTGPDGQPIGKIFINALESHSFYSSLADVIVNMGSQLKAESADLKPILNLVLLGLQAYQQTETQEAALRCL